MQHDSVIERHWPKLVFVVWMLLAVAFLVARRDAIASLDFFDPDDHMRLLQVRAWLDGQSWFDLRQYRLSPPAGADMHWSRVVDLPIAGLILLLKTMLSYAEAERAAVAIAPLLPLLVTLLALGSAVRNLIGRMPLVEYLVMFLAMLVALGYFAPLRIDHHGWQLAMLACVIAAIADPKPERGGALLGMSTALSFAIGLEMLPFLAIAAASCALRWAVDEGEAGRLRLFGITLSGGTGLAYLGFASLANQVPRCDALSPVWLSQLLVTSVVLAGLSYLHSDTRQMRLVAIIGAGLVLALGFALVWPHCLGRLEGASPELNRLWLSRVKEARPLYAQDWPTIISIGYAALLGIVGALCGFVSAPNRQRAAAWASVAAMSVTAALLLFWQARLGASAQILAVAGGSFVMAAILPLVRAQRNMLIRVFGTVAVLLVVSGMAFQQIANRWVGDGAAGPQQPASPHLPTHAAKATMPCHSLAAHQALARLPKAIIFAPIDITPRLILLTQHDGIAGPYHRNQSAILDVFHAFGGTPEQARAIVARHRAEMVLICPGSDEASVLADADGETLMARLEAGRAPEWLEPVALPDGNPFMLWRVRNAP